MAPAKKPEGVWLCRCGGECEYVPEYTNGSGMFPSVTCKNPKCKEFEKKQLPTWGKHKLVYPEVTA